MGNMTMMELWFVLIARAPPSSSGSDSSGTTWHGLAGPGLTSGHCTNHLLHWAVVLFMICNWNMLYYSHQGTPLHLGIHLCMSFLTVIGPGLTNNDRQEAFTDQ